MRKIGTFIKKIIRYGRAHKSYWLPGVIVFFILFAVSSGLNMSMSYMGNSSDEIASMVLRNFWHIIAYQVIKILLLYLLCGIGFNIIYYTGIVYVSRKFKVLVTGRSRIILTACLLVVSVLMLFMEKMIVHPQMFIENFTAHAHFLRSFQYFLTDHVPPIVFSLPYWIINLSCLGFTLATVVEAIYQRYAIIMMQQRLFRKVAIPALALVVAILGIVGYTTMSWGHKHTDKPNILIIGSDALRPDRFSYNGYQRKTTPNIDTYMEKGVQFRNVITALPRTLTSWMSILTSQYSLSHDINHMFPRSRERSEKHPTAVRVLHDNGYYSAVISDSAGEVLSRVDLGFDAAHLPYLNFDKLIHQIILEKQTFLLPFVLNKAGRKMFPELRGIVKLSDLDILTRETIDEIESAGEKPFFITTFYSATHFPFAAPYPYYNTFAKKDYQGPYKYYKQLILSLGKDQEGKGRSGVSERDKQQVNDLYDGCLNAFDREFGRLMSYLDTNGLLENTIVLVVSDHGENIYDYDYGMGHGEHLKGNTSLEVACFLFSEQLKKYYGKTYTQVASTIDIMPTLFDLAGIDRPDFFRGTSLFQKQQPGNSIAAYVETGIWFDNSKKNNLFFQHNRIDYPDITKISDIDMGYKHEMMVQEQYQNVISGSKYRAIYAGDYKLIYMPKAGSVHYELYNHRKDPHNLHNLAGERPGLLQEMQKKLFKFVQKESNGNYIDIHGYLLPVFSDPIF